MATQDDYIKTALRLPRPLHAELLASAESKGRSLNAELIARLHGEEGNSEALVQVIARQNATISELELVHHSLQLKATALAQYLRVFANLLEKTPYSKDDGFNLLLGKAAVLVEDFPPDYDSLRKAGEEKMRKFDDANAKLVSLIQAAEEMPLTASESARTIKRVLKSPSSKKTK